MTYIDSAYADGEVDVKILADNLRGLRAARKWTQHEAAQHCGLSPNCYMAIELGRTAKPRRISLQKIANAYGITYTALLEPTPTQSAYADLLTAAECKCLDLLKLIHALQSTC